MSNDIRYGMKRKSIKKLLREKISAWIETIADHELRVSIKNDTIVTGGSIASMLLGEKINDFDIYFRTKSTTKAVAEYYVSKFNGLNSPKVAPGVENRLPFVKEECITNCRSETENVIKIYIKSAGVASEDQAIYNYFEMAPVEEQDTFVESIQKATKEDGKYRPVFLSQNAITLSDNMQIVIRFHGEPSEIHRSFDFIHAMNYYDYKNDNLELKIPALEALMSRTLLYCGSLYPIASLFRMKKFMLRGWRMSAGQILKIAMQISELDLTDQNVLREQLTGCDAAYFYQILGAVKDVDPEKINSAYISEIVDRIFGESI